MEEDEYLPLSDPFYRRRPDGKYQPLRVDEQWEQAAAWEEYLKENPEVAPLLLEGWKGIKSHFEENGFDLTVDMQKMQSEGQTLFEACLSLIDSGIYPPPHMLMALLYTFTLYIENNGAISLEEALFGRSISRSGNLASRRALKHYKEKMRIHFMLCIKSGASRQQAAELVSRARGGKPEPESILRMMRCKHTETEGKEE